MNIAAVCSFNKGQNEIETKYGGSYKEIENVIDRIDAGVEIVPVKQFANEMSAGVSCFEQLVWDLKNRGVSNIDIPVLISGIDA